MSAANKVEYIVKMDQVFYPVPAYLDAIVERLSKRNWLVHNFNLSEDDDLYNPANYLQNLEFDGTRYVLIVDLNIYQFLLNIVKKPNPIPIFRDAASLLVFCQITNINIDPTFSVYEKVNYQKENLAEALPDLELFHRINNGNMDEFAKFALEYSDSVEIDNSYSLDYEGIGANLMKYNRLKEWDSLYLMILSIIDINNNNEIPRRKKIEAFSDWMIYKFRRSLVAFVYAVVLFGDHPIKRMMKYKKNKSPEERRRAVCNMTWDLYIMNQFFRKWTKKDDNEEFLYASDDSAFCLLLREAVQVQIKQSLEPIKHYMNQDEYEVSRKLLGENLEIPGRAYDSNEWGSEYRADLIEKYEHKLYC